DLPNTRVGCVSHVYIAVRVEYFTMRKAERPTVRLCREGRHPSRLGVDLIDTGASRRRVPARRMEGIRQILLVIFRMSLVTDVNIVRLIESSYANEILSAFFLRRHPGDVIIGAVIL